MDSLYIILKQRGDFYGVPSPVFDISAINKLIFVLKSFRQQKFSIALASYEHERYHHSKYNMHFM